MKKRLLITSIVMMLVVAVALSTATYAWFTSNTQVTASQVSLTAGTSQSTALGIQWSAGTAPNFNSHYGTSVTAVAPSTSQAGGFQPAAPVALNGITTEPVFKTEFINAQGNFKGTGSVTDVYRFNGLDTTNSNAASNVIHIANLAQSGFVTVYLTATIATAGTNDDAEDLIRVAVYEITGSTPTYTYKGLLGATAGAATAQGTIATTETVTSLVGDEETALELNLGTLNAQTDKAYAIYVWLDGAVFDEAESTKAATIDLSFKTTKTSSGDVDEINAPEAGE